MVKVLVKNNMNANSEMFSKTSNEENNRIRPSYNVLLSFLKCKERKKIYSIISKGSLFVHFKILQYGTTI